MKVTEILYILQGSILRAQGAAETDISAFIRDSSVFINSWPSHAQILSEFAKYRGY